MESEELCAWLGLSLAPAMTPQLFRQLLTYFRSPLEILDNAPNPGFYRVLSKAPALQTLLQECREHAALPETRNKVRHSMEWAEKKNHHIITLRCENYPTLLKEISDPPALLYIAGSPELMEIPLLALVGSRKPSPGGRAVARALAVELTEGGYGVCSGMALGIDTESHQAALDNGGSSIAVLGCGVDVLYPKRNRRLAEELMEKGALLSEFPLGAAPESWHFPKRNRIISGLSQGVVVLEAARQSGSLITAKYALEQGREVFAVPGSLHNPLSRGCHQLLKNGAKLVESAADIVEELGAFIMLAQENLEESNGRKASSRIERGQEVRPERLDKSSRALLKFIDHDVVTIDQLTLQSGLDVSEINRAIVDLEMKGLVLSQGGGYTLSPVGA